MSAPNLVELAIGDLTVAAAILRKPRGGVLALDIRNLAGARAALDIGPAAFDVYLGAIEAGLSRMRGLRAHGYDLVRGAV